ncbi:hypothetical protein WN943_006332 [Citrus x changshan-huyou]
MVENMTAKKWSVVLKTRTVEAKDESIKNEGAFITQTIERIAGKLLRQQHQNMLLQELSGTINECPFNFQASAGDAPIAEATTESKEESESEEDSPPAEEDKEEKEKKKETEEEQSTEEESAAEKDEVPPVVPLKPRKKHIIKADEKETGHEQDDEPPVTVFQVKTRKKF